MTLAPKAFGYLATAVALTVAFSATPAVADANTEWQERHKDLSFLAGRWLGRVYGDEFVIEGDRLILAKKRTQNHADKPVGFALVTNLRFKEIQRSNPSTVYYAFTGTCQQLRPDGTTSSYPAPGISVSVSSSLVDGMISGTSSIGSSCFGNIDRPPVLLPVAEAMNPANLALADDDPTVEREVLGQIAGPWVSRHESDDSEVTISGREVRLVRTTSRNNRLGTPAAGTLVGLIDVIKPWGRRKSPITGEMIRHYVVMSRSLTTNGEAFVMASWPSIGYLRSNTLEREDRPYGQRKPVLDYQSLTAGGIYFPDMWRPDDKARIFGKAPLPTPAAARPATARPTTAAARPPQTTAVAAPTPPPDTLSIPVTSEQEQRELAERERLNREQAEFGTRQLAENEANRLAFEQAVRDREATIARQQADYEAKVAAVKAERLRREREHAARMAQWRADVEACKKGDKSKCAK